MPKSTATSLANYSPIVHSKQGRFAMMMEMTFVVFHSSASQAAAVEEAVTGWFDMSCWTVP
jgi:hypothetical protein